MNKLMKKIKKLENDTISKQLTLEQVNVLLFCIAFADSKALDVERVKRGGVILS